MNQKYIVCDTKNKNVYLQDIKNLLLKSCILNYRGYGTFVAGKCLVCGQIDICQLYLRTSNGPKRCYKPLKTGTWISLYIHIYTSRRSTFHFIDHRATFHIHLVWLFFFFFFKPSRMATNNKTTNPLWNPLLYINQLVCWRLSTLDSHSFYTCTHLFHSHKFMGNSFVSETTAAVIFLKTTERK
jgi:hypothetical protein